MLGAMVVAMFSSPLVAVTPRALVDDLGHEVQIDSPPARVISLAPSITETVFALGVGERLVGVSSFCDYPPAARELARVGGFATPDIERILALAPDVVLLTTVAQQGLSERLKSAGILTWSVFPRRVDELSPSIRRLGEFLGVRASADSLAGEIDAFFASVASQLSRPREHARPRVFFEIDSNPLMTVTDDSFEGSLLRALGAENIAGGLPRSYARIDPEAVILGDPDVIVITHRVGGAEELRQRRGWNTVHAVKERRVFDDVDPDLLVRPGPRILEGARALLPRLHSAHPLTPAPASSSGPNAPPTGPPEP